MKILLILINIIITTSFNKINLYNINNNKNNKKIFMSLEEEFEERKKKYFENIVNEKLKNINMREFCETKKSLLDFYIGYYPFSNKNDNDPIYIGYFSINPFKRLFSCKSIIQNPNFLDDSSYIINFKQNIDKVSRDAKCKFIFDDLKNLENKRYWMSWFHN
jgi:hypothetical protein